MNDREYWCPLHKKSGKWPDNPCPVCLTKAAKLVLIEGREMVPVDDAIEYGECPVCGAEPGQQCSTTDLSEWQPEGPAYVSTTELAGWVHPER